MICHTTLIKFKISSFLWLYLCNSLFHQVYLSKCPCVTLDSNEVNQTNCYVFGIQLHRVLIGCWNMVYGHVVTKSAQNLALQKPQMWTWHLDQCLARPAPNSPHLRRTMRYTRVKTGGFHWIVICNSKGMCFIKITHTIYYCTF